MISARGVPLTGSQIISQASDYNLLPYESYGTVVKTLQARIAEDILKKRSNSRFVRTAIGTYFLRELIDKATIFGRIRCSATRAPREKPEHPNRILFLPINIALNFTNVPDWSIAERSLLDAKYFYQFEAPDDFVPVATAVSLRWANRTFVYTVGNYTHFSRLIGQRSFHIRKFLDEYDLDLFETDGTGATSSSARALLPVLGDGRRARIEGGKLTPPERVQFFQVAEILREKKAFFSPEINCVILSSLVDVTRLYSQRPAIVRRLEYNAAEWVETDHLIDLATDVTSLHLLATSQHGT